MDRHCVPDIGPVNVDQIREYGTPGTDENTYKTLVG